MRERFDLPREDVIVSVIVADARQRGRVHRERLAVQPGRSRKKRPESFRSHMLRLGGTPAVSAPEYLFAVAQRRDERIHDRFDLRSIARRVE